MSFDVNQDNPDMGLSSADQDIPEVELDPSPSPNRGRPIWHPQVFQQFHPGGTIFYFVSSLYLSELTENIDDLLNDLGIVSYFRYTLFGPRDMLLAVHIPEMDGDDSLTDRINRLMRGAGNAIDFKVSSTYRFGGQAIHNNIRAALDDVDINELEEFQNDPSSSILLAKFRERDIVLGLEINHNRSVRAFTIVSLVYPDRELIRRLVTSFADLAEKEPPFKDTFRALYEGAGYGSILIQWEVESTEELFQLVAGGIHNRLRLVPAARTDTYVVANIDKDRFDYAEFRPENMEDFSRRMQRYYPGFASLPGSEQVTVSDLYIKWKLWLNRRDEFAHRFIEGAISRDTRRQLNVIAELGDRLEEELRRFVLRLANQRWDQSWRDEVSKLQKIEKGKPFERWNLGDLVEAASQLVKWASDRNLVTTVAFDEVKTLRIFTETRNSAVHSASRDEFTRDQIPQQAVDVLSSIFPIYYRLEDAE